MEKWDEEGLRKRRLPNTAALFCEIINRSYISRNRKKALGFGVENVR
jgi:hypothetical protein